MPYIDSPFPPRSLHPIRKAPFFRSNFSSIFPHSPLMVPEMEKPRVTEIKVRVDCNGCVQKIKKALNGITGIYDIYIDFSQQKITIIGWADPEKLVKAIKKTRKAAVICVHTEQSDDQSAQPTEPTPEGAAAPEGGPPPPPPEPTNPPPEPTPTQVEASPPPEAPKEPEPENPPPESANTTSQSHQDSKPKDLEEVHVIHQHPPDYGYRHGGPGFTGEPFQPPQPIYVSHSYNTYKPSPYVTEYTYPRSPPRYLFYNRSDNYTQDYHRNYGSSNITSMFSEENPNACSIV